MARRRKRQASAGRDPLIRPCLVPLFTAASASTCPLARVIRPRSCATRSLGISLAAMPSSNSPRDSLGGETVQPYRLAGSRRTTARNWVGETTFADNFSCGKSFRFKVTRKSALPSSAQAQKQSSPGSGEISTFFRTVTSSASSPSRFTSRPAQIAPVPLPLSKVGGCRSFWFPVLLPANLDS